MQSSPQLPWRSLLIAVALVPLAVGVIPLSGTPVTLNAFVQAKVIVLALGMAFTLGLWALGRLRGESLYSGRQLWPLGALLVLASASTVLGMSPRIAFFGDLEQGSGLLVLLLCSAALLLLTQLLRAEERLRELTSVVVLTAAGVALVGLLQQLLLVDALGYFRGGAGEWLVRRGYGTIGNPDTYAAYLVLPAFLALHRVRHSTTRNARLLWGGALAAILGSFLLAQTRGPLVGLVAAGALYAFVEIRTARASAAQNKKPAKGSTPPGKTAIIVIGAALVVAVGAGILWGDATQFAARFFDFQGIASLGGRLPMWESALRIAADNPLLGVGPDTFRLGWYPTRTIEHLATGAGLIVTDPHNVYLHLAATMGIPALAAFVALLGYTLYSGFGSDARARLADYDGWLLGLVALTISLLTSMFALVLIFMLFVGIGVILAPLLHARPQGRRDARRILPLAALAAAAALVVFAGLSATAQAVAVGARTDDPVVAAERASRASSIAPWDTGIRHLRDETTVNAALEAVFGGDSTAPTKIADAEETLNEEQGTEPEEYLHFYRTALLLIGAGQHMPEYTAQGIDAGLEGLKLYPNSVELRTGLAAGFIQLDQPARAEVVLEDVWNADPNYLPAGTSYAEALIDQGKTAEAQEVLATLLERFPDNETLAELQALVSE